MNSRSLRFLDLDPSQIVTSKPTLWGWTLAQELKILKSIRKMSSMYCRLPLRPLRRARSFTTCSNRSVFRTLHTADALISRNSSGVMGSSLRMMCSGGTTDLLHVRFLRETGCLTWRRSNATRKGYCKSWRTVHVPVKPSIYKCVSFRQVIHDI
jgi:hypothetical protein